MDSERLQLTFRLVTPPEVDRAFEIESAGYPPDEAATKEKLEYRLAHAGDYFLGAYTSHLIGFVCGTLSKSTVLEHESMQRHEADGGSLCIHSVVVATEMQRKGIGAQLLTEYIKRMRQQTGVCRVLLISKPHLVPFYESTGFRLMGASNVVHGADTWYEMRLDL